MKIHLHEQGIHMVGKAWEIKRKLKEYGRQYDTVLDWITNEQREKKSNVIIFPCKIYKP